MRIIEEGDDPGDDPGECLQSFTASTREATNSSIKPQIDTQSQDQQIVVSTSEMSVTPLHRVSKTYEYIQTHNIST